MEPAAIGGPPDSPVSSLAAASASMPVQARARRSYTLQLLEGDLTLTLEDGSTIRGTYQGTANVPSSGQSRATLDGVVTGGTGLFAGATGDLSGSGTGGIADDGEFSLALRAAVSTGTRESFDVRVALKGNSKSTCTTTAPPRVALDGTGRAKGKASVTGHLEHNLGTVICAIVVE